MLSFHSQQTCFQQLSNAQLLPTMHYFDTDDQLALKLYIVSKEQLSELAIAVGFPPHGLHYQAAKFEAVLQISSTEARLLSERHAVN